VAKRRYLAEESMALLEAVVDELENQAVPLAMTA